MVTLPQNFNFPGAQQGIPQGIFSLIQNMGMGGMGSQLGGGLGQSIGQLMNPGIGGINTGAPPVLPKMPVVPRAPVVEPRGPRAPIVDPARTPVPMDFSTLSGTEFRHIQNTGRDLSGKAIDKSKMPAGPTGKQRAEIERNVRNNPGRT